MARKKANIHYLYKTTCIITGRYYIGLHSTSNLEDGYMGSGKRLRYSIRKYGIDNHKKEILEFFESRELLVEAEKKAITIEMIVDRNCMNLKHGGTGGLSGLPEDIIRKIRLGASNWILNKWKDGEYRSKIIAQLALNLKINHKNGKINYNTFSGKKHSDNTKKIMSEKAQQRVGEANSQYGTYWITKDGINKKIKKEDLEHWLKEGWVRGRK